MQAEMYGPQMYVGIGKRLGNDPWERKWGAWLDIIQKLLSLWKFCCKEPTCSLEPWNVV